MEAIKDTVSSLMYGLLAKKTKGDKNNPEEWLKKILTKKELGHIKVNYFKGGVLNVSVDSSAWLYSLSLKKEAILESLKENHDSLKDIRFRIGETR